MEIGYETKDALSYAVGGSEGLSVKLMEFINKKNIKLNVHCCTAALKDKVQLANRIKRRAKNVKRAYDKISAEGTLIRGVIYLDDLKPCFNYRLKLEGASKNKTKKNNIIKKLKVIKNQLKKDLKINDKLIEVDERKLRILASVKLVNRIRDRIDDKIRDRIDDKIRDRIDDKIRDRIDDNCLKNISEVKKLFDEKKLFLAVVEEYPTYDGIEVDVEFL